MGGDSTSSAGDAIWQSCLNKAAMLILDVYNYSDDELPDELKAEKAKLWDHWEKGWNKDLSSGMFCRMYYPIVPDGKTKEDVCPPALIFRGSEMNDADIEELAVHFELDCTVTATGLPGLLIDTTNFSPSIPTFSPTGRISPTATRAELLAEGLNEEPLILPSAGRETLHASLGGAIGLGNIHFDWTGSASLFYGSNGDWPTNIAQALGKNIPTQYRQAIYFAKKAASEAMADWNGRLMILGHSLGGGLASAAALAAKKDQPDLALLCNTYNAAGLHPETAELEDTSLSAAAGAGITANCVNGDILTSLQTRNLIPLMSDVLGWADVTLPEAIPNSAPTYGYSPGGPPSMMFTHFERAPKWHSLPPLFPLRRKSLVQGDLDTIQNIFDAASDAHDFEAFVSNILGMLFRELGDRNGAIRTWHLYDFYRALELYETQFRNAAAFMLQDIQQPPPLSTFPVVNFGDSNYMRNQVNPFVNGILRDTVEFSQILMASVDYHMWDACAYTFLLDPPEDMFRWSDSE